MRIWAPPRLTRCWITRATCCPAGFVNVPGQKSILVRGLLTLDTRSLFLMADLSPTSAARCSELRGRELELLPFAYSDADRIRSEAAGIGRRGPCLPGARISGRCKTYPSCLV